MRLIEEYFLTVKEREEISRSVNKLTKKKLTLDKIIKDGGLRWINDYGTHTNMFCQGFIREEIKHKVSESDLAVMLLGVYPDYGGYVKIYPNNFFEVSLDYLPRALELKKAKKIEIGHA